MVAELTRCAATAICAALVGALVGCGDSGDAAKEPTASVEQSQTAAATWTPEMKEKFKAAHERARAGQDDKPADGGSK